MSTYQRLRAANALRNARASSFRPPMTVIEGIAGMTATVVYDYRGHKITRTYRTHDARNQTHNGYWYAVSFKDGTSSHNRPTRKEAKELVNRYERDHGNFEIVI
jgi:hypothetical protein